ncbi:MAG TPA: tetratricopeptide repeat protein [Thermoanaerobaculia bacterium]|nr:tetratricopeptide repeat protein [Thermoanaerobaculia bacterium]
MRTLLLLLFHAFAVLPLAAHDELADQIHNANHRIEQQPRNAELYLQRGELYRLDEEWEKAERDYRRALQLDPALEAVHFGRGLMLYESGRNSEAIHPLQRFIANHPDDPHARVIFARVLMKLGRPVDAAVEYDAALTFLPWLDPDVIVERARALAAAGRPSEALQALDDGMAQLGLLAALQLTAIEIELQTCHAEKALLRIEASEAAAPRKESWLARRGDILHGLDREEEARAAYRQALEALALLPPERRQTRAMRELENRLRTAIQ